MVVVSRDGGESRYAYLRFKGRNYDYWVLHKVPPEASGPPTAVVIQAIQAACPAVKIKK